MAVLTGIPAVSRAMPQGAMAVAGVAMWMVIPVGWSIQVLRTLGRVERQMTDPVPNEAMVMMFRTAMMLPVIGYGPLFLTAFR